MRIRQNLWILALCATTALGACAPTQQARETKATTGFLGADYALLTEGGEGEALRVYRKRGVNLASYNQIRLTPVTIWAADESSFQDFSPTDRQKLADRFYAIVHSELSKDYKLVGAPGAGVLDIQIALTDAKASNPTLDTVSTVVPIGLAASSLTGALTGKPAFVGEAQAEAKVLDGATGELLAAAVDRRVGGKSVAGSTESWGDVEAAFTYWAQQLRYRLCTDRGATNCVKPEA